MSQAEDFNSNSEGSRSRRNLNRRLYSKNLLASKREIRMA